MATHLQLGEIRTYQSACGQLHQGTVRSLMERACVPTEEGSVKVKIDQSSVGTRKVPELASELFVVDPDDKGAPAPQHGTEQLHAAVEQAVRACPRHAIAIDGQPEPLKE